MKLVPGLYEQLVTGGVDASVRAANDLHGDREPLGEEAGSQVLARYVHDAALRALRNLPDEERLAKQVALTNQILAVLRKEAPNAGIEEEEDDVVDPAELLLAIRSATDARLGTGAIERPSLPLRHSDLLVNGPRDLRLGSELRRELASADRVDVLVSFVKGTATGPGFKSEKAGRSNASETSRRWRARRTGRRAAVPSSRTP